MHQKLKLMKRNRRQWRYGRKRWKQSGRARKGSLTRREKRKKRDREGQGMKPSPGERLGVKNKGLELQKEEREAQRQEESNLNFLKDRFSSINSK